MSGCARGLSRSPYTQEAFSAHLCLAVRKSRVQGKDCGAGLFFGTGSHSTVLSQLSLGVRAGAHSPLHGCTDVPSAWISCPSSWAALADSRLFLADSARSCPLTECFQAAHSLSLLFPHCMSPSLACLGDLCEGKESPQPPASGSAALRKCLLSDQGTEGPVDPWEDLFGMRLLMGACKGNLVLSFQLPESESVS